ncbi:MAG: PAS domain-containing protein [Actinomycetota bacterium]|nr:PAS domain-containing protein [Actinomycetota bacterium]
MPVVTVFALVRGAGVHGLAEVAVLAVFASGSTLLRRDRALSTTATSVGLLTCSAVLVHLSGGVIELHFHFFVMVGVVVLYQEWLPFLCAIGYVVVHHGTVGIIDPESVYNHPAAINNPLRWAAIHGFFILAMSAAGIAAWRLNKALRKDTVDREQKVAEAQRVAHLGSWELDLSSNQVVWSDEQYRLFGLSPDGAEMTCQRSLEGIHPDDRHAVERAVDRASRTGDP